MPKRVLISGISSYTGRQVAAKLALGGWDVHGIVRSGTRTLALKKIEELKVTAHFCTQDYHSYASVCNRIRPQIFCHLASASGESTATQLKQLVDSNIILGGEILEAAYQSGCRGVISAGSYWDHYAGQDLSPSSLYAATKIGFRYILDWYARFNRVNAIELRLFDSYGPLDERAKFLSRLDLAAKQNSEPVILTPGNQLLSPIHINDVGAGFLHACNLIIESEVMPQNYCKSFSLPGPQLLNCPDF